MRTNAVAIVLPRLLGLMAALELAAAVTLGAVAAARPGWLFAGGALLLLAIAARTLHRAQVLRRLLSEASR
ncbi:MAG: hypothetical protein JO147_00330 [Actinobacteria bacterium]|nr:hypothetical protein [Actinomycetota bacterium]